MTARQLRAASSFPSGAANPAKRASAGRAGVPDQSDPGAAEPAGVARSTRAFDRLAMAHDTSHYLLVPQAVATPATADEVAELFRSAHADGVPLTLRSGGTSLSGQGITDGVLVDVRRQFRDIRVLDRGERVRVQPGVTVRQVNAHLARHRRRLGPDPASEIACTIGGVVANNSSGMACGIEQNTYRTLESMVVVLPGGAIVDTGASDADGRLRELEPELHAGLAALRDRVRGNTESMRIIAQQFAMKNTMGYGVNSFVDFERPVDILAHLMIGSEGTLGFVAEAVFRTVEVLPCAATGLAIFSTLSGATAALPALVAAGLATIELMDATSLRVAQTQRGVPAELAGLDVDRHAALLVEVLGGTEEELAAKQRVVEQVFAGLDLVAPVQLTGDRRLRADLWHIRKGLYTAVAEARPSGTTALLEDIVVPVPALLDTCERLIALFDEFGYEQSVIFGHAKDGNIHFMLNERFDDPASLERYERFTEEMVELVLANGGSLKAEHGTGRIMAPFVRRQYGDELYAVMREVKRLFDPRGILNPGAVLSDDPRSYLENLKLVPTVEEEVDRCVECGYCEPVCPSKDVTTTPRQRIVIRREMRRAEEVGDAALLDELRRDYEYAGNQTCAVDGMCQVACPVNINTGDLTRRLRQENASALGQAAWKQAATHWGAVSRAGGAALTVAAALPAPLVTGVTKAGRALLGAEQVPLYDGSMPRGGSVRRPTPVPEESTVPEERRSGPTLPVPDDALASAGRAVGGVSKGPAAEQLQVPEEASVPEEGGTTVSKGPAPDELQVPEEASVPEEGGTTVSKGPVAVYFPACIGTMFGPAAGGEGVSNAFLKLCERAGVSLVIPDGIGSMCCGTPWKSKGFSRGYDVMTEQVLPTLWDASRGGELPIVCDAASCTEGLGTMRDLAAAAGEAGGRYAQLRLVDAVEFVHDQVLDALTVTAPVASVALHHTCSSTQLGTNEMMTAIAERISDDVYVPAEWGCCGFAGDRGLLHPELTESATAREAAEIGEREFGAYASTNRTCELGMTRATGREYQHVLELLEAATRAGAGGWESAG